MDKIADSIIDKAHEWAKNHKGRTAVVIVNDMKTDLSNALVCGSKAQIKSLLMTCMLQDKNFARCIKDVAEDYDDAAEYYRNLSKETTDS